MRSRTTWIACALVGAAPAYAADAITAEVELGSVEDVESFALSDLLEQPVTAASGYAAKPSDSPTIVSTVDHDTIDRFGYRTLREVVQGVRGVYVGNDRNYSYLGARGFSIPGDYNTRFALSIDNHGMNDAVYGQASIGAELGLPMIAIERVELVRGGAWSVHGENALLGALQIVSASGATRPGIHVTSTTRITKESFEDPANRDGMDARGEDVSASYGTVKNGVDVFVAGAYSYDPGMSALYMPELAVTDEPCVDLRGRVTECNGVVHGNDGEEVGSGFAAIRTKHLTINLLASRRVKDVPTASFGSIIGDRVTTVDSRAFADVQGQKSTERYDVIGRVGFDYFKYDGTYPFADPMAADGVGRYLNFDSATSKILNGQLRGRYRWDALGEHVTNIEAAAGVEGTTSSAYQWGEYAYPDAPETYIDRTDNAQTLSLSGHTAARFFDHVVGVAALRGDYHADSFGWIVSPQAGVVIDGGDIGRIRLSMSRGYRPPTAYERFYLTYTGAAPAMLRPELSATRELGLERYLGEHMRLLVVGFTQDVQDLIGLTSAEDGTGIFTNAGSQSSYGIEAELEGRWDRLQLNMSYTRQKSTTTGGAELTNSPASVANLRLLAPIAGGRADVGVDGQFVNSRRSYDGTEIQPLFSINTVLTVHDVVKSLDASLGVTNVLDERGGDPGGDEHRQSSIPHDPRTVWLRLSVGLAP